MLLMAGCSDDRTTSPSAPIMSLSNHDLSFESVAGGSNPGKQKVTVSNVGVGIFTYRVTPPTADWIRVDNAGESRSVSASGAPDTIRIYTVTARVAPGTHVDSVFVSSNDPNVSGSAQYIRVTFTVGEAMRVAPTSLLFSAVSTGSNPDRQYFKVESAGGGTFNFTLGNSSAWLQTTATSGTAPDSVGVDIDVTGLPPGLYTDTIVVSHTDTSVSPVWLPVTLAISSWTLSNTDIPGSGSFFGLHLRDDGTAWAIGSILNLAGTIGILYKSPDMGETWQSALNVDNTKFANITFADDANGCLVGDTGLVMLTSDTGTTWSEIQTNPGDSIGNLWSVSFANADTGWAAGTQGTIIRTTDAGQSWTLQESGTTHSLADIAVIDAMTVWIVGNHGNVLKTVNAGETWAEIDIGEITDLWSITFSDANSGWIVGDMGFMMKSEDGGVTWEERVSGTPHKLADVYFYNNTLGWAVGNEGSIIHTNDGGATWLPQFTGSSSDLSTVRFFDQSTGLVVANGGVILKTISGGF
jgi:photosystem II stability/assembly factor-like uncharacterized protein